MMKPIFFLLIVLFIPFTVNCQDLNGIWKGGLPQNDNTILFIMEVEIQHEGEEISGKAKYVDPTTDSYVIEKFIGSVKNNSVKIDEFKIVESKTNSGANYSRWCVKTITGNIIIDEKQNSIIIEGTWSSVGCGSGKFILSKESKSLTNISGVVYDKENSRGIEAELIFENNGEIKRCKSSNLGNYSIEVSPNKDYRIMVKSSGFQEQVENLFTQKNNLTRDFFMEKLLIKKQNSSPIPVNQKVRLKNLLFKISKSEILPESNSELNRIFDFLQNNPSTFILIEGHTDRVGDSNKNLILSKQRAEAIKKYLTDKGVNGERITTVGYGDKTIICKPGCKENRRVEFVITKE